MTPTIETSVQTIHVEKTIEIAAPIDIAWEAVLEELGPGGEMPDGKPFPMVLEARVGGRWYRDLGGEAGHLWGHVQVIKPTSLLEISGPMFMSFPAVNHLQYRLTPEGGSVNGTRLKLVHRGFGLIPEEVRTGVHTGWNQALATIRKIADRIQAERR